MTHLDSTVFIDLLGGGRRGEPERARALLGSLADEEIATSVFVACELRTGALLSDHPAAESKRIEALLASLSIAYPDERFADRYAAVLADLSRQGQRIATMDLLIATTALVDDAALVTRNRRHFARVPGLRVRDY